MGKIDLIYDDFERVILSKHKIDKETVVKYVKEHNEKLYDLHERLVKELYDRNN
jgi:hypothetical protein